MELDIQISFGRLLGDPVGTCSNNNTYVCPFCETPKFGLLIKDSGERDAGIWHCFVCGRSGNGFDNLCRLLDVVPGDYIDGPEIPIRKPKEIETLTNNQFYSLWSWIGDRSSLSVEHREMLLRRGIENPSWFTLETNILDRARKFFGDEVCTKGNILNDTGKYTRFAREGSLIIKYPSGFVVSYNQNTTPKKMNPKGYIVGEQVYSKITSSEYLVITEGEIKAESNFQAGLSTIGLPGVQTSHDLAVKITNRLNIKKVIILFDTDTKLEAILNVNYGHGCIFFCKGYASIKPYFIKYIDCRNKKVSKLKI